MARRGQAETLGQRRPCSATASLRGTWHSHVTRSQDAEELHSALAQRRPQSVALPVRPLCDMDMDMDTLLSPSS
jgi:hypothetical protein